MIALNRFPKIKIFKFKSIKFKLRTTGLELTSEIARLSKIVPGLQLRILPKKSLRSKIKSLKWKVIFKNKKLKSKIKTKQSNL
jgi:hypothetical protein